jgi:hypothetical protein
MHPRRTPDEGSPARRKKESVLLVTAGTERVEPHSIPGYTYHAHIKRSKNETDAQTSAWDKEGKGLGCERGSLQGAPSPRVR